LVWTTLSIFPKECIKDWIYRTCLFISCVNLWQKSRFQQFSILQIKVMWDHPSRYRWGFENFIAV